MKLSITALLLVCALGCSSDPAPPTPDAGCDVPTSDDVNNCGGCGIVCAAPHASMDCDLSECIVDQCEPGWEDADRDPSNGCEVSVRAGLPHGAVCQGAVCTPRGPATARTSAAQPGA